MKSDLEALEALNKVQVPEELWPIQHSAESDDGDIGGELVNGQGIGGELGDGGIIGTSPVPNGLLCFPLVARMPPAMQQPTLQARRSDTAAPLYVGLERIGDSVLPPELPPLKRARGERGEDRMPRRRRRCACCIEFGSGAHASSCKGRGDRRKCEYFNQDGTPK